MSLAICSLASGSSGNCYMVRSPGTALLVDAGISARRIRNGLALLNVDPDILKGVLVTHEHSDHISGLRTLTRRGDLQIFANEQTFRGMHLPLPEACCRRFSTGDSFRVGELEVRTFAVSHDTADPVGYSLSYEGQRITIVTDTGTVTQALIQEIRDADILVLESNHDESILRMGSYPWFLKQRILGEQGHLSNEAAARALAAVLQEETRLGREKPRRVLLAHLSRENNFPEMAVATMENILEESGCAAGRRTQVVTLSRTEISPVYCV